MNEFEEEQWLRENLLPEEDLGQNLQFYTKGKDKSMDLTQALLQSTTSAETVINGSSILIERFSRQCLIYDVRQAGHDRYHKAVYGDIQDVIVDIYENDDYAVFEDGQLEQADWEPSSEQINIDDCNCRYCAEIR